jgi:hypothetical protein
MEGRNVTVYDVGHCGAGATEAICWPCAAGSFSNTAGIATLLLTDWIVIISESRQLIQPCLSSVTAIKVLSSLS